MVYLIVGLDAGTRARGHQNVLTHDVHTATRIARSRAAAEGIDLVVAAVIGPNSSVVSEFDADHTRTPRTSLNPHAGRRRGRASQRSNPARL
jgi:hypothetical protein